MYCVCYEGLPIREVVPDPDSGIRINVASSIDSDFLQFPTLMDADAFAAFLEEFCVDNYYKIRKVV